MAQYIATVYVPGQPKRQLNATEVTDLVLGIENGLLTCWGQATETALGVDHRTGTDIIHVSATVAIWAPANAADTDAQPNPEAEHAAACLVGEWCEFNGPILIVEQTASQPEAWVDGLTFIEEQPEPAAGRWFQLLQGPAGYYIHSGPTGAEPTHQYGPYSAQQLRGGRFGASVLTLN